MVALHATSESDKNENNHLWVWESSQAEEERSRPCLRSLRTNSGEIARSTLGMLWVSVHAQHPERMASEGVQYIVRIQAAPMQG